MNRYVLRKFGLMLFIALFGFSAFAQETPSSTATVSPTPTSTPESAKVESHDANIPEPVKVEVSGKTTAVEASVPIAEDEKEIIPFYRNYLERYTLGPTDVISIEVFGQCPNYCKTGITIPPDGRIQYPLIRGGVFVAGRTIEDITKEIGKKLDEYIIDPQVTITLDKAMSSRYSVLGKVVTPGVRVMERRVTLWDAIIEAGGLTKEGNKKNVMLYRYAPDGKLTGEKFNLDNFEKGRLAMVELRPGDQIFVPGSNSNLRSVFAILEKATLVRFLFGVPF